MINSISCSSLDVKWRGNKNQAYIVKATFTDPATNNIVEAKGANISCDDYGNCGATIPVKEGNNVSWSVQAICSPQGITLYSSNAKGPDANIPLCEKKPDSSKVNAVHVYPNPTTNYLIVEYSGEVTGIIEFKIFDIAGKKVFDKFGNAVIKTNNQYKLDLRNLLAGIYLLKVNNGNEVTKTKFVLLKK